VTQTLLSVLQLMLHERLILNLDVISRGPAMILTTLVGQELIRDKIFEYLDLEDLRSLRKCSRGLLKVLDAFLSRSSNALMRIGVECNERNLREVATKDCPNGYCSVRACPGYVTIWKDRYNVHSVKTPKSRRTAPDVVMEGFILDLRDESVREIKITKAALEMTGMNVNHRYHDCSVVSVQVANGKLCIHMSGTKASSMLVFEMEDFSLFGFYKASACKVGLDHMLGANFSKRKIISIALNKRKNNSFELSSRAVNVNLNMVAISAWKDDKFICTSYEDKDIYRNHIVNIDRNGHITMSPLLKMDSLVSVLNILEDVALINDHDFIKIIWLEDSLTVDLITYKTLREDLRWRGLGIFTELVQDEWNDKRFICLIYDNNDYESPIARTVVFIIENKQIMRKMLVGPDFGWIREDFAFPSAYKNIILNNRSERQCQALDLKTGRFLRLPLPYHETIQCGQFIVESKAKVWIVTKIFGNVVLALNSWKIT